MQTVLEVAIFGYILWLGLYLIARDIRAPLLRFAGLGALIYALMLALDLVYQSGIHASPLDRVSWPLPVLLSAFWCLAILNLAPLVLSSGYERFVLIGY